MSTRRRFRSAVACQGCRQRKIRCSVTVTGVPCIVCSQDGTECIVPQRALIRHQRKLAAAAAAATEIDCSPTYRSLPNLYLNTSETCSSQVASESEDDPHICAVRQRNKNEGYNGDIIVPDASVDSNRVGGTPFLTGAAPRFNSILNPHTPPQQPLIGHSTPLSSSSTSLPPEDREYLERKGVFSLPQHDTCAKLLQAYFHHVHLVMPVVDANIIINFSDPTKSCRCNLLLLWSMFFVAVNFIPADVWKEEGYQSQKDMKDTMYYRAKCMYDHGSETDQVVLLQSSLLMGFWHSELDQHTQPWYWTGIAISLCQMMGLYRDPDSGRCESAITYPRRYLWRRLWWSCFFRDRWLSLTLGRPLRINLNDCDTPMPSDADILNELAELPESLANEYIPSDSPELAKYWITLIQLSTVLGEVLISSYQLFGPSRSIDQVKALEAKVLQFHIPDECRPDQSNFAKFYLYHVQLHYQALLITFYRPYIIKAPEGLPLEHKQPWQNQIRNKLDRAALQTNALLDALVREKLLSFACPMTPPLLVPAMHIHLLNCNAADSLSRHMALNKLDLCMMVMEVLQETYVSASVVRGVFLEALQQLDRNNSGHESIPQRGEPELSFPRPVQAEISTLDNEGLIDVLMDEASIFNILDSLYMI
ncbi:hypothetical protein B7463_g11893, partial [Scytalidium lignicola]